MKILPRNTLVLIEVADKDAPVVTESGITIPPKQWAKPSSKGVVLAIGKNVEDLNIGDKVIINPYAVIDTDNKLQKLIHEKDILTTWEE